MHSPTIDACGRAMGACLYEKHVAFASAFVPPLFSSLLLVFDRLPNAANLFCIYQFHLMRRTLLPSRFSIPNGLTSSSSHLITTALSQSQSSYDCSDSNC
ncbi:hypothetical protein BKA56DRAFT_9906 [Ilyonectria sp. MPI-CAGE-AT-0026]|nr:hypothetical protein BKA56DRAFT_9906 [Ilyonectria sp. MPI-CAGE-AT-0026]